MEEDYKLHRVNTKIPEDLNNWLDEQSKKTGMSKSSIIMLAVQSYHDQRTVMKSMGDIGDLLQKFDELKEIVERNDPK